MRRAEELTRKFLHGTPRPFYSQGRASANARACENTGMPSPPTVTRQRNVYLQRSRGGASASLYKMATPQFNRIIKTKIKNVNYFHFTQWPSKLFQIAGTPDGRTRTFEGWRLERVASLARESGSQLLRGIAVAPRGYCWGRHLRLSPKAVNCEQGSGRNGEANCEG